MKKIIAGLLIGFIFILMFMYNFPITFMLLLIVIIVGFCGVILGYTLTWDEIRKQIPAEEANELFIRIHKTKVKGE